MITVSPPAAQQLVYQQVYHRLWIVQVPIAMQHQQMLHIRIVKVAHVRSVETLSPTVTNSFDACSGGTITMIMLERMHVVIH